MAKIFMTRMTDYADFLCDPIIPVGGKPTLDVGYVHIYRLQCSSPEKLKASIRQLFKIFQKQEYVQVTEILRYDRYSPKHGTMLCMDFIYRVDNAMTLHRCSGRKHPLNHPILGDLLAPAELVQRAPQTV